MSPRTGRPKIDNPKSERMEVRLTREQMEALEYCAEKLGKNKSEVIVKGIEIVQRLVERNQNK